MTKLSATTLLVVSTCLSSLPAAVLIQDDFNDGIIDAAKWSVYIPDNTVSTSIGAPAVNETGGELVITSRGYLNSAFEIDPDDYAGGIRITGSFRMDASDDFFQVLTRTQGTTTTQYGETDNGIEFVAGTNPNTEYMDVKTRGGNFSITGGVTGTLDLQTSEIYDFEILDTGSLLSITVTERGTGTRVSASETLVADNSSYTKLVTFHNREGSGRVMYLDNIMIE
ncbi:MAG: hypothetical protein ACQKBY_06245 [Verrucomicrobiales bacterium]